MSKQLIKVAKELNVGTNTIVEHLNNKGYDIENKPNAKVTDEMYDHLLGAFKDSIVMKEKADQLTIGTARPSNVPKEKESPSTSTPPAGREQIKVSFRDSMSTPAKPTTPAPAPVVVKEEKVEEVVKEVPTPVVEQAKTERTPLGGLKILGKIDLDARNKPKPIQPEPQEAKKVEVEKPIPTPPVAEPAPVVEKPVVIEKVIEPTPVVETPAPVVVEKPKPAKPVVEAVIPPTPVAEPPVVVPVVPVVEGVEEVAEGEDDNFYRAESPQLKGLKILGKIDTGKFDKKKKEVAKPVATPANSGNRPPRADGAAGLTADQKKKKRKRKKIATEGGGNNNQSQSPNNNNNQGGGNTGGGDRNQRDNNRPQGQGQQGGGNTGNNQNQNRPRPQGQQGGGHGHAGNNQNRPRPQGQGGGHGHARGGDDAASKEISQKEIDEKIKATMARITGGGGKKKRQKIRRDNRDRMREKQELIDMQTETGKLQLTEFVSVSELASLMDVSVTEVITSCMNLGVIVSINQRLDAEIIEFIANEFGYEIEFISAEEQTDFDEDEEEDDPKDLVSRAPIVTVMGHVDHGKTSLLDYIRLAKVAEGEAGGITQHVGAYEVVTKDGKKVTFLDTPGHEAFTAMRARGAKVTDVAVIIVAADDDIMPQTKEAISHAQAAGVPIVFAINKIDKAGADPERIKNSLAQMNFLVEEWGGKYQSQDISAKKGTNVDLLLEKILLEAEVLDLKANPNKRALGTVIEASLEKGRGYVSKLLVQDGTLNEGDPVVSGEYAGKIKAMFNEVGGRIKKAGPSTPVLVLGLSGAPQAGEKFKETQNESDAKQLASKRAQISREQSNRASKRISLDEIGRRLALGNFKELNLIIKGDVDGSIEALSDALLKQSIETVQVNVLHKAVGQIIESDVLLASASDAIIIGFQVRPSPSARKLAEREGVEIKTYSIIYQAIEELRSAIEGMLEPTKEEKVLAQVEVREVYKISKVGTVAGCYVQEGKVTRGNFLRVIRDGIVVFPVKEGADGRFGSLKRFKEDMKEVRSGFECGITIDGFNDIQVGDTIEVYEIIEVKQTLK